MNIGKEIEIVEMPEPMIVPEQFPTPIEEPVREIQPESDPAQPIPIEPIREPSVPVPIPVKVG